MKPACMSDSEHVLWLDKNRTITDRKMVAPSPCHDCPLGFAADMRLEGRCDGSPGGIRDDDGALPPPPSPERRAQMAAAARRYRSRHREYDWRAATA